MTVIAVFFQILTYMNKSMTMNENECRLGCAACCIAVSISSAIPGMLNGKKAGERCIQLDMNNMCLLFGKKERPEVCSGLKPSYEMCGESNADAFAYLENLERETNY